MKLKNYVLAACLAMLAFPAFATNNNPPNPCGNHGNNCDPTTPTPGGDQSQQQDQNQHQSNEQGQGQSQTATGTGTGIAVADGGDATATGGQGGRGGDATSGSLSGAISGSLSGVSDSGNSASLSGAAATTGDQTTSVANGSNSLSGANASNGDQSQATTVGNSTAVTTGGATSGAASNVGDTAASSDNAVGVNVDASNNSRYTSQALLLPSNPTNIPVGIAGSNVTVYYGTCGPLKAIETNAVTGTYFGLVRKHKVHLGQTDRIVAYEGAEYIEKSYPDGSIRLFGHQAVRTVAVVSVAGGRSINLGGGQTGGGWGQAGAGGSSAMQQVVNQIDLEPCEAYHSAPLPPRIEFAEPRVPRG